MTSVARQCDLAHGVARGLGRRCLWLSLAILVPVACAQPEPEGAAAGNTRLIDPSPICPDCEIVFREVATLGDSSDPGTVWHGAAGDGCMVGRLSTGEFLLGGVTGGGEIFVYGPDGRFLRSIGRQGEGPGELRNTARVLVGQGDTLFVVDDGNVRMQVLTPSGDFVQSFRIPAPYRRFARLQGGGFVFSGSVDRAGDTMFHLMDQSGREVSRLGPSTTAQPEVERGLVSPRTDGSGGFWTASILRYSMEEWSADGMPVGRLTRAVDWFPPDPDFPDEVYESIPPPTGLFHMGEDDVGRIWTYVLVPDPEWRPDIPLSPRPTWYRETFDHVVEVIDVSASRLIASGTYEDRLAPICNSNLMYTVVETPAGDMRVKVVEPTIVDG